MPDPADAPAAGIPVRGSFYDQPDVFAAYQSHRGSGVSSPNQVMEEPAVVDVLGPVAGLRVVDLGCGDARFGQALLAAGCRSYLGIDNSIRMVERAQEVLGVTTGRVVCADLQEFPLPSQGADLIVSRLALHYVADLTAVLTRCYQGLAPGGRLVITVVHPVITSHDHSLKPGQLRGDWTVDRYFDDAPRPRVWMGSTVMWYHRTIENYVTSLTSAGFTLSALRECAPVPELFGDELDELARRRRVPLFLLLAATKPS